MDRKGYHRGSNSIIAVLRDGGRFWQNRPNRFVSAVQSLLRVDSVRTAHW